MINLPMFFDDVMSNGDYVTKMMSYLIFWSSISS